MVFVPVANLVPTILVLVVSSLACSRLDNKLDSWHRRGRVAGSSGRTFFDLRFVKVGGKECLSAPARTGGDETIGSSLVPHH